MLWHLQIAPTDGRADVDAQFKILSMEETNGVVALHLSPKSSGARRFCR